jgi:HEAT repeat protein
MVAAFGAVVAYRDAIRVRWWAYRLAGCDDPKERVQYAALLASRREQSLPGLRRLMASDDAGVRSVAVMVLNTIEGEAALELLVTAAGDPDAVVRRNAIVGISMHEAGAAAAALGGLVDHPDESTGMLAVSRLGGLRSEMVDVLLARLAREHPSAGIRAQAIETIEVRGGDSATEALSACLEDDAVFSGLTEGERGALEAIQSATAQGLPEGAAGETRDALGLPPMTNGERAAQAIRRLSGE